MHVEHLLIDRGTKMSKSLGNVFTVQEILDRGYRASALRYALISTHYRKQLRFTWDSLSQAEEALTRLMDCLARLETVSSSGAEHPEVRDRVARARTSFAEVMQDDLNTPGALGVVFELVRDVNAAIDAGALGADDASAVREAFDWFDQVLGVIQLRRREESAPPVPVDEIERLIEERRAARSRRDFAKADEIRHGLAARGIILEDSAGGTRWKRK